MHQIITAVFILLRLPFGSDAEHKALRRRQVEQLLRALGLSRRKAERVAHRIP